MMIPSRRKLGAAALIIAGIGAFLVPFLLHSPTTQGTSPNNNNNGTHAKDFTSSSIVCTPGTIASGGASNCTATVPDTTTSSNTPTGTVSFASSNPGIGQVAASCTLSAGKCTTGFTGVAPGTVTVTGTYSGDSGHNGSSGSSDVVVATQTGGGTTDDSGGTTDKTGTCTGQNPSHSDVSDKTDKASATDNTNDLSVSHTAKSDPSDNTKSNAGHAYGLLKHQMDTTVALVKSMGTHNSAFHSHHDTKTDNKTVHTEQASSESSNDHDSSCTEKEETNDD